MSRDKTWQAKMLDDAGVLDVIAALRAEHGTIEAEHVREHFAGVPRKVVDAKLDSMDRRGLIVCRGDDPIRTLPPMWTVGQLVQRADYALAPVYVIVEPPDVDGLFVGRRPGTSGPFGDAILDSTVGQWRKASA